VIFDNLANFLSISPNQTTSLPSVCLVPAGFFCHPVSVYTVSLRRLTTYILLDFKVAKWAVSERITHAYGKSIATNVARKRFAKRSPSVQNPWFAPYSAVFLYLFSMIFGPITVMPSR
jgi:hypothetical protein